MLIISRKKNERIMIGDDIEVVVVDTGSSRVRLGVKAPREVSIQSVTVLSHPGATIGSVPVAAAPKPLPDPSIPPSDGKLN